MKLPPQLPPNLPQEVPEPTAATKQRSKPKRISKAELISQLRVLITSEQWDLIAELRGIPVPVTEKKKDNYLTGIFKKKITISSAKGKARNLQQWLARKISEFTGVPWGKDEEIASREMGQAGADVRMSRRACVLFPFTAECKSGDQWSLPNAIKQCKANLYDGTEWLVCIDRPSIHPEQRISPIIIIDGETFFKILHRCGELVDLCQMNSTKPSDKK